MRVGDLRYGSAEIYVVVGFFVSISNYQQLNLIQYPRSWYVKGCMSVRCYFAVETAVAAYEFIMNV